MDAPAILVTAVGGDIGLATIHALAETDFILMGCDQSAYVFPDKNLGKIFKVPPASCEQQYIEAVSHIINTENIAFYFPISESEIQLVNNSREAFAKLPATLVVNNNFIIDKFLDKYKTAIYLESLDIKTPGTFPLSEYSGELDFPLIIKSRFGSGSKRNWLAEDQIDIEYYKKKDDGSLIVQEYIGSHEEEFTTGVFSDGENTASISFNRKLGFGGLSVEAELADEPALDAIALKIAAETGLIGSINIQTRRVGNRFIPFEINPRISSTLLFRKKFGFNDAVWWINVLSGKSFKYEKLYKTGKARRVLTDIYYDLQKK